MSLGKRPFRKSTRIGDTGPRWTFLKVPSTLQRNLALQPDEALPHFLEEEVLLA